MAVFAANFVSLLSAENPPLPSEEQRAIDAHLL
jgi:hypothetical protein